MVEQLKSNESEKLLIRQILGKIFLDDWAMKLTALLITFGLWFGVTGLSTPTVKRMFVPLNFSLSNNAEITNTPPQEVEIIISGDKRRIDQINRAELVAALDLTDVSLGDRLILLTPETVSVTLPQGVKLIEVLPIRIAVKLEAVEEKDIEVKAVTEGNLAGGFEIYNVSVLPQKIRVRGPASFIQTLDFVKTEAIGLEGKNSDFTARQVPVGVDNPKSAVLNTVVDVFFRIGESRIERSFLVPVSPFRTASVTLYGPRTLLSKARADAFNVEVNADDTPQLTLPPELRDFVEVRKLTVR